MEISRGRIRWIDILKPAAKDLGWLKKELGVHPVIIRELQEESARARVENYGSYLYLIYQFPVYDQKEMTSRREELDFIITKKEVVTAHYQEDVALTEFKKALIDQDFQGKTLKDTLQLTYQLLQHLLNFSQRQLVHINEKIEKIADELFREQEKELLKEISYLKRDISEHRLIIRSQEHLLKSLTEIGSNFWGKEGRVYLEDLFGEYMKLLQQIESYQETIRDFSETNDHILNVKTNEIMKNFTILAFTTFPLVLIVSLLEIHAPGTPLVNQENGFWVILGLIIVVIIGLLVYFKKKKLF